MGKHGLGDEISSRSRDYQLRIMQTDAAEASERELDSYGHGHKKHKHDEDFDDDYDYDFDDEFDDDDYDFNDEDDDDFDDDDDLYLSIRIPTRTSSGYNEPQYDTDRIRADFAALGDQGSWYGWIPAPVHDLYGAEQLSDEEAIELARNDGSVGNSTGLAGGSTGGPTGSNTPDSDEPSSTESADGGKKLKHPIALTLGGAVVLIVLVIVVCQVVFADDSKSGSSTSSKPSYSYSSSSSSTSGNSSSASMSSTTSTDSSAAQTEETEEIPRLPKLGMSARYIDSTELGAHNDGEEVLADGRWKGGTAYYWSAYSTGDRVFSAIVKGGEVVKVNKYNTYKNYWADGSFMGKDFPDMNASGERVEKSSSTSSSELPNVYGYDDPSLFADDAEDYFRQMGSSDPWQDAYAYWEKHR